MSVPNLAVGAVNLADTGISLDWGAFEDNDYPATNLLLPEIAVPARTTSCSDVRTLREVLPAPVTLSRFAIALVKPNFTADATVQPLLYLAGGDPELVLDGGVVAVDQYGWWPTRIDGQSRNTFLWLYDGDPLTFDYFTLDVSDTSNPAGKLEAARLYLGELITPDVGFAYDWSVGFPDPSVVSAAAGGNRVNRRLVKAREGNLSLKWLTEAEAWDDFFSTIDAVHGRTGDCLWIPLPPASFPGSASRLHKRMLWGPQGDVGAVGNPVFQKHSKAITFLERT